MCVPETVNQRGRRGIENSNFSGLQSRRYFLLLSESRFSYWVFRVVVSAFCFTISFFCCCRECMRFNILVLSSIRPRICLWSCWTPIRLLTKISLSIELDFFWIQWVPGRVSRLIPWYSTEQIFESEFPNDAEGASPSKPRVSNCNRNAIVHLCVHGSSSTSSEPGTTAWTLVILLNLSPVWWG